MMQFTELRRLLAGLIEERRGAAMVYFAVLAPVIIGSAALSVDIAFWHMNHKSVQSAADAAVVAATGELMRSGANMTLLEAAARDAASRNGVVHDGVDTIVTVYNPPPAGAVNAGDAGSVHVVVTRPSKGFFTSMFEIGGPHGTPSVFEDGQPTVRNHATARGALNRICIWVLSPDKEEALLVTGSAIVNLSCGAFSNSNHSRALVQQGSSQLITPEVRTVGVSPGIVDGGGITADARLTGVSPVTDPKATQAYPVFTFACAPGYGYDVPLIINSGTVTISPGGDGTAMICRDLLVKSGGTLIFDPGVYIFDFAGLRLQGSAVVTGTDVLLFWTDFGFTSPFNDDTDAHDVLQTSSGSTLNLRATNTGATKGFVFFHHRTPLDTTLVVELKGGAGMNLTGIIYSPSLRVMFAGGASLDATASLLIVDSLTFAGNTEIGSFDTSGLDAASLLVRLEMVD